VIDERPIGAALPHDVYVQGEHVDADLDNLIERRHRERVKEEGDRTRSEEEAWRASERRQEAKRAEEDRRGWVEWHRRLEIRYGALAHEHARTADYYEGLRVCT
jgi:hypothetical protein